MSITHRRHASTASSSPGTASPTTSGTSPSTPPSDSPTLTWNDFFRLRQRRRYFNLSSSILLSSTSFASGVSFISQQNPESMQFFGMDPLVGMAASCLACMGAGWLAGPLVGSALFKVGYRGSGEMAVKEKDFCTRIKRYRIDPSSSSMQNPVPDYYGEKITSVAGYRQWLKDQRAFNKKRQSFL